MLRDLLLFSLLVSSGAVFAQSSSDGLDAAIHESAAELQRPNEKNTSRTVGWNLEFASEFQGENKDEALAVMTGLGLDINFNFGKMANLKVSPEARFYSARSQNRFDSDNFEDRITLSEGYLRITPLTSLFISAGTHSQKFIDQSQLISGSRSFPGIMTRYSPFSDSDHKPAFTYQEAVPTSYTYNAYREDKEALPGLRVFDLSLTSKWSKNISSNLQLGQMSWRNLPTKVAFTSGRLGNSYTGELAPGTRFAYGFSTTYLQAKAAYCEDCTLGFFTSYKRANNSLAPSDAADAQMLGAGISYRAKDLITRLSVSDFFSESDVTPGQYASSAMGNNNRQGMAAHLDVEIPSLDLKIKSQLIQARPINPDPYQYDMTSFYLGVETDGQFL